MKGLRIVLAMLAASLSVPPALHAQSLGDIAKTAQEQRDKAKAAAAEKARTEGAQGEAGASASKPSAPTKGYTNKDLSPAGLAATPVATKAAVNETSNKTATEKPDEPVKDETYWRGRMTVLRDNLSRDNAACEPLAEKVRALDALYADSVFYVDGKAMVNRASAAVIETKQADAKADLRQCVVKVASDLTAIGTAEEEARRLSVIPGWLR